MYDQLVFGICFYNDPSIFRLLNSLPREVKKIIIDGKFAFNPSKELLSDERMRQQILQYDNVELIDCINLSEPEKRQLYLTGNDKKYLFIIDSDEYIVEAGWDKFYDKLQRFDSGIHDVMFQTDSSGGYSSYPRIWVNPADWSYVLCHNIFRNNRLGTVLKSGNTGGELVSEDVIVGMNDDMRNEEYIRNTYDYQVEMMKFEKPYRQQYREGKLESFI